MFPQLIVTPMLTKHRILTQVAANNADIVKIPAAAHDRREGIDRFVKALDEVIADLGKFPGPVWEMGQNFVKAMRTADPRDKELAGAK
jgi:ornithine--oxo-acid transaminase